MDGRRRTACLQTGLVIILKLIEACGLKGYRIGGACVSPKHANFIVNDQGAKASDVEALVAHIAKEVKNTHGVSLVREVHIVGEG